MTALGKGTVALVALTAIAVAAIIAIAIARDGLGDRAGAILDEPAEFVGERVTVEGELSSYYPEAMTLGGGWLNNEELLVLVDELETMPQPIRDRVDDVDVRVTGVVGRMDESLELVPGEQFEPFENGAPYVRATRVEVIEG